MIQKKMICQDQNKSLIISAITLTFAYVALIMMILAVSTNPTNQGIGDWSGTAKVMEETAFGSTIHAHIEFGFFLMIIPSLMITMLIVQGKTTRRKLLILSGITLMIQGLLVTLYLSVFLLPPVGSHTMKPVEGFDFVFVMYRHVFWFGGIMGFFITLVGITMFWWKRK